VAISSFLVVWLSPAFWLCGYLQLSGCVAIFSFLVVWLSPAFWLCGYFQLSGCVAISSFLVVSEILDSFDKLSPIFEFLKVFKNYCCVFH
jgi:hypothetical protein